MFAQLLRRGKYLIYFNKHAGKDRIYSRTYEIQTSKTSHHVLVLVLSGTNVHVLEQAIAKIENTSLPPCYAVVKERAVLLPSQCRRSTQLKENPIHKNQRTDETY
jgi:hypothetical protein